VTDASAAEVGTEPEAPGRRMSPGTWAKVVFGVAVLVFGALFVANRWDELSDVFSRLSWGYLLAAIPPAILAQLAATQSYRAIMADLGAPLPPVPACRVYFVSQLGKYLPGTVWGMVALVALSKDYKIMKKTSIAAGVLSMAFSIAVAFVVAAALLPFGAMQTVRHFWYVGLLVPVLLLALHPRVVGGLLDWALRKIGRLPLPSRMSYPGSLRSAGWMALSWLLFGVHAWVLVLGFGGDASPKTFAVAVGGFALSYGIGPLFLIAPAGAGVRETAIVLTLGGILGGSTTALALALVSRVILVGVDFGQAGVWSVAERRYRDRYPPVVPSPVQS
jgi:glycosyltransferase 2 family protein